MLKKTITYKDLDGNDLTEDFYFNLTKAELIEQEVSHSGGFRQHLERIVEAKDGGKIMAAFKSIISSSYGVRSIDNKSFVKTPETAAAFMGSGAYEVLFMELVTDPTAASAFINGLVPQDLREQVAKEVAELPKETPNQDPLPSRRDLREAAPVLPEEQDIPVTPESPQEMEARIRAEVEAKLRSEQ